MYKNTILYYTHIYICIKNTILHYTHIYIYVQKLHVKSIYQKKCNKNKYYNKDVIKKIIPLLISKVSLSFFSLPQHPLPQIPFTSPFARSFCRIKKCSFFRWLLSAFKRRWKPFLLKFGRRDLSRKLIHLHKTSISPPNNS